MRKVSPSYGNRGCGVKEMRSRAHVVAAAYARALRKIPWSYPTTMRNAALANITRVFSSPTTNTSKPT